jgi:hypothetical protein
VDQCRASCPPSSNSRAHISCSMACGDAFQRCHARCP